MFEFRHAVKSSAGPRSAAAQERTLLADYSSSMILTPFGKVRVLCSLV
jgi:uncharacterized membrane protein YidH (DUF202 family)